MWTPCTTIYTTSGADLFGMKLHIHKAKKKERTCAQLFIQCKHTYIHISIHIICTAYSFSLSIVSFFGSSLSIPYVMLNLANAYIHTLPKGQYLSRQCSAPTTKRFLPVRTSLPRRNCWGTIGDHPISFPSLHPNSRNEQKLIQLRSACQEISCSLLYIQAKQKILHCFFAKTTRSAERRRKKNEKQYSRSGIANFAHIIFQV